MVATDFVTNKSLLWFNNVFVAFTTWKRRASIFLKKFHILKASYCVKPGLDTGTHILLRQHLWLCEFLARTSASTKASLIFQRTAVPKPWSKEIFICAKLSQKNVFWCPNDCETCVKHIAINPEYYSAANHKIYVSIYKPRHMLIKMFIYL